MGIINQGSQSITFDYKLPAKGSYFNKLNRNVIRPGIYSGLKLSYVGNNVFVSKGTSIINCQYNFIDNLQIKIDFDSIYDYGIINPTTISQNEVLYLEYEYGEVNENFADFKHTSSGAFDFNNKNLVILGELIYNISNNISSISYNNRSYGLNSQDLNYAIPDNTKYYNVSDETKFFYINGSNLPTGTKKINIPTFSESEGDLLITNNSNTTIIKNNLNVNGVLNVTGTTSLSNATISDRLTVDKFYGRVPIGSVIPIIGVFQSSNNGGTFTSASLPSSGSITDDGFQICDGALINNVNSIFNGKYTPNITDDRFIQGSTVANIGLRGSNTSNTITISTSNLPTHTHDISHIHSGSTTSQSSSTTGGGGAHNHNLRRNIGGGELINGLDGNAFATTLQSDPLINGVGDHSHSYSHTHNTSTSTQSITTSGNGGFANNSIDIRPKYINAVYVIRVL